mmetsp:Transcript_40047/g.78730  ORF Transcript_40047/g.78730 Transcript_40047/m.78730 type:complete len:342 (-) Transcript_40047:26-1051(-)|eukprot:CAMPEP_0175120956 /NCGR_PEP_ID=MMETSP0087-20121206/902_1 /TAXON_ID=136419 /ORGANISM="Unknown Unknown, Strain D1" /LENGTH=341 /DNA_ID=CAMNT_0016402447 /DNA_START=33 /DNA_END=1058 /DNA_ORIENTATION=+
MYLLYGGDGSPYSAKIRALLRYRRIPFLWKPMCDDDTTFIAGVSEKFPGLPPVIPVLVRPDGSFTNDSTPIILELDSKFPERKVVPSDPVLAFLSALVEDFADEWMTKVMFEGRFHTPEDSLFGASWQGLQNPRMASSRMAKAGLQAFANRQFKRRYIIGCEDWDSMNITLTRLCSALTELLKDGRGFLFGLPSNADFALFGQLRMLVNDPFPAKVVQQYPAVWGWVLRVEDLSGWEGSGEHVLTPAALSVLKLISETHIPFLLANASALRSGAKEFEVPIFKGAKIHQQPPFKYQGKCLKALCNQYAALDCKHKRRVNETLEQFGVDAGAAFCQSHSAKL